MGLSADAPSADFMMISVGNKQENKKPPCGGRGETEVRKTVLITGASGGIGSAAAELFAADGWNVALHYRRARDTAFRLAQALRERGCDAEAFCADVTRRTEVEVMFQAVRERFGAVHALVNNAGIAQQKLFTDLTEDDWDAMMDVDVKGVFHCTQCVLPDMIRRGSGAIVNVSSMWGMTGASCEVHYSAAKAAVIGLTKALAKEVGPSGIRVNCVAPGVIDTPMNAAFGPETLGALKEETPLGRLGTPAEAAQAIRFLASDASGFITGQVLSPNGGFVI